MHIQVMFLELLHKKSLLKRLRSPLSAQKHREFSK
jgi:hypothetical protein